MTHTARLTKDRARKPLVEGAHIIGSQTCDHDGSPVYRLTLFPSYMVKGIGYELTIDRTTMLDLVASWMASEARDARCAATKKEKEAAHHPEQKQ